MTIYIATINNTYEHTKPMIIVISMQLSVFRLVSLVTYTWYIVKCMNESNLF